LEITMNRTKRLIALGAFGVAALGGGIAVASTSGAATMASPPTTSSGSNGATVNVASASVNGRSEQILVDSHGLPLYTYAGDTRTQSAVAGQLAAIWPPLVSNAPSEHGASGLLDVVHDANGAQVQYEGHFLYTFASDSPGHVTGQGIQNFFVATPGHVSSTVTSPNPVHGGNTYSY
jgi:predicted lipoprotein with Yx(FWY)xxD motif